MAPGFSEPASYTTVRSLIAPTFDTVPFIITVYRQENYSSSNQQLRTDSKQQPDVVTANEPRRRTSVVRRVNWKRRIVFASLAVLLITVGWAGYYFGMRRQKAKSNSVPDGHERFAHHENTHREEPAQVQNLSSSDVEESIPGA
jgi:hypothetical protein